MASGQWKLHDFNFDNVRDAFQTLYVVASLETWPVIMFHAIDITDDNQGPTKDNNRQYMIFFVLFILFGTFFLINFFIGVLFMKFKQAQRQEQRGFSK